MKTRLVPVIAAVLGAAVRESNRVEVSPAPVVTVHRGADGGSSLTLPTG